MLKETQPYVAVSINGKKLSDELMRLFQTATVRNGEESKSDTLSLTFQDPEYRLIDSNVFRERNKVDIEVGYVNDTRSYTGYRINKVKPQFPDNGTPSVTIECLDESSELNKQPRSDKWTNIAPHEVAIAIAKRNGLKYDVVPVDAGPVKTPFRFTEDNPLMQRDMSDSAMLAKLAKDFGFKYKVVGNTLKFLPTIEGETRRQPKTLVYRDQINGSGKTFVLKSFSPAMDADKGNQVSQSGGVDLNTGKHTGKADGKADKSNLPKQGQDSAESAAANSPSVVYDYDPETLGFKPRELPQPVKAGAEPKLVPATNVPEQVAAQSQRQSDSEAASATASGELKFGSNAFDPGDPVLVEGVGRRCGGAWRITEVTLQFGQGFTTSLKMEKRGSGTTQKDSAKAAEQKQDATGTANPRPEAPKVSAKGREFNPEEVSYGEEVELPQ